MNHHQLHITGIFASGLTIIIAKGFTQGFQRNVAEIFVGENLCESKPDCQAFKFYTHSTTRLSKDQGVVMNTSNDFSSAANRDLWLKAGS